MEPLDNHRECTVRTFPRRCAVHSPTFSGVRVTAEMGEYVKTLYEVPGPLIVIEDGATFLGVTWNPWNPCIHHTKPDIEIDGNGWRIIFPKGARVKEYPSAGTLQEAVSYYCSEHSTPSPPGKALLGRIKRCITLDMWLIDGRIVHNYADACRLLKEMESLKFAKDTLLYLLGWHAPYDTRMPAWEPAEALGGRQGFRELIELSKSLGAIVMPHMNFWGYDKASGLLENWEEIFTGGRWRATGGMCPQYPICALGLRALGDRPGQSQSS